MTGEAIVGAVVALLTAAGFWKGAGYVVRAWKAGSSSAAREVAKARKDATEAIDREKETAHKLLRAEYDETCKELAELRKALEESHAAWEKRFANEQREHHQCVIDLTRALAWLTHHERTLRNAKADYVPFNPSSSAETPSEELKIPPAKKRPPPPKG